MTWLVTTQLLHGELTLLTTGEDYPMLAGNLVALFFSAFLCIGLSIIYSQKDPAPPRPAPAGHLAGSGLQLAQEEAGPAHGSGGGVGQEVGGSTRGRRQQWRRLSCQAAAGHQAALKLAASEGCHNSGREQLVAALTAQLDA
ncbi:hypothetical protein V8C86DRAFT_3086701 [Haematococcus lacustris]